MDKFLLFASNHPYLIGAIIMVSLMLFYSFFAEKFRGFTAISPAQSTQMINRENAVIIDVREMNEHANGHIINSVHIPLSSLKTRISELKKYKKQKLIVACRTGNRSSQACSILKKGGFEDVFSLSGGVMAWENAGLPLVK